MKIPVKTASGGYDIILERGALSNAGRLLQLSRRVLIVTDSGVPDVYAETLAQQCKFPFIITLEQGEATKNLDSFRLLLEELVRHGFTRSDCVAAVGGGMVGDLAGFAAASYMRGIDFYNLPTTVLSQVDSSIGGKTAVDFMGLKNIVGAFYQPSCVIIDPDTLKTLPKRQVSNGLAEALKMSLTSDAELFSIFENGDITKSIDTIIERSLLIKKSVVERDEREAGLRKILNFGHTLAHAVESVSGLGELLHGECVAVGMPPMCSDGVKKRLLPVLDSLELPHCVQCDPQELIAAMRHDKKITGDDITVVFVPEIGRYELRKLPFGELCEVIKKEWINT